MARICGLPIEIVHEAEVLHAAMVEKNDAESKDANAEAAKEKKQLNNRLVRRLLALQHSGLQSKGILYHWRHQFKAKF